MELDVPNTLHRVMLLGASGSAGRATAQALVSAGYDLVCIVRPGSTADRVAGAVYREADPLDPASLLGDGFREESFDALVSCLASRTGLPDDARAVDHDAHSTALALARDAGVRHMVLLSAICVQKPELAFQHAKLAFEQELMGSGLRWSIVRPTAFFKSLSGQIARVEAGKPYLLFGDGTLTACKPISDRDLGAFMAECLTNEDHWNRVLPIGGPGPALTPVEMGQELFRLTGKRPRYRRVPVALMDRIIGVLDRVGKVVPPFRAKAEFARIGRYYATESMLVLDPETGAYSAEMTPETGEDRLFDYYAAVIAGDETVDLGDHAMF